MFAELMTSAYAAQERIQPTNCFAVVRTKLRSVDVTNTGKKLGPARLSTLVVGVLFLGH